MRSHLLWFGLAFHSIICRALDKRSLKYANIETAIVTSIGSSLSIPTLLFMELV